MTADTKVILAAAGSIDQTESVPRLLGYGLQHVLVTYAGAVAVPLQGQEPLCGRCWGRIVGSAWHCPHRGYRGSTQPLLFLEAGELGTWNT
ncbi:MAG: hypothetical protein WCD57_11850 [Acidobacteriaceae bacterium]